MRSIAVVSLIMSLVGFGCGGDDGGDDEMADDMTMVDAGMMVPDGVVDPEPFKVPLVHRDGTVTFLSIAR